MPDASSRIGLDAEDLKCAFQGLTHVPKLAKRDRVIINVGGVRHETAKATLKQVPNSRLASCLENDTYILAHEQKPALPHSASRDPGGSSIQSPHSSLTTSDNLDLPGSGGGGGVGSANFIQDEYFFDRHPVLFTFILNFYRTGKLHIPNDMCGPLFQEELEFWGIDENLMEPCCWTNYVQHRHAQQIVRQFDHSESSLPAQMRLVEAHLETRSHSPLALLATHLWLILDQPQFSFWAKVYGMFSIVMVIASIAIYSVSTTTLASDNPDFDHGLKVADLAINVFFTIELLLKFICCPSKQMLFSDVYILIDILAMLPVYPRLIFFDDMSDRESSNTALRTILEITRIPRIMRIFKLARHLTGLKILLHTIKASMKELLLLVVFVLICTVIFSTAIFYTEYDRQPLEEPFASIPAGFWWALVTMTTLGYGDMVPSSDMGRVIGAICSILGVMTIALPVPIIVNNFAMYYSYAQARSKLEPKRKPTTLSGSGAASTPVTTHFACCKKAHPSPEGSPKKGIGQRGVKDEIKVMRNQPQSLNDEGGVAETEFLAGVQSADTLRNDSGVGTQPDQDQDPDQDDRGTDSTSLNSLDAALNELNMSLGQVETSSSAGLRPRSTSGSRPAREPLTNIE